MVLLASFVLITRAAHAEPVALTYEDVVRRASADPESLSRAALLARFESELTATGRVTREGPTLEAEVGPRGDERVERAPEHAAHREPQVELGQVSRVRSVVRQLAVAGERGDELEQQVQRHHQPDHVDPRYHHDRDRQQDQRQRAQHQIPRDPLAAGEGEREGEEVDCERHHPEQRGGDERAHGGDEGDDQQVEGENREREAC
jgi:hypothetical protein